MGNINGPKSSCLMQRALHQMNETLILFVSSIILVVLALTGIFINIHVLLRTRLGLRILNAILEWEAAICLTHEE